MDGLSELDPVDPRELQVSHTPAAMDEPDYVPLEHPDTLPPRPEGDGAAAHETCRICRSEGTQDEPLFYPCKCSGSIKFVHQECLMEWLSHSHKKHCELCKTPFRFTKLYDANMPNVLPWTVFVKRAIIHLTVTVLGICRGILVGTVWLVALPWLIRWAWRWMFWFADAGWAREAFIHMTQVNQSALAAEAAPSTALPSPPSSGFPGSLGQVLQDLRIISSNRTSPAHQTNNTIPSPSIPPWHQTDASVLSSWTYISQLTSSPRLNRVILYTFEGQLITCVVITGFILVFLIREWVVQQQPLVNLDILNNEERERDRQQRELDRLHRLDPPEEESVPYVPTREERADLESFPPLHERSTALERALRDMPRSASDVPPFIGWEALTGLMDDTTQHLEIPGAIGERIFTASAAGVTLQVRAAHNEILDCHQVARSVYQKIGTYSDEEQLLWERVIGSELCQKSNAPSALQNVRPDVSDIAESSAGSRRPPMPERDRSSRAAQIQRSLEEAEDPVHILNRTSSAAPASEVAGRAPGDDGRITDSPVSTGSGWQLLSMPSEEFPAGRSLKATFDSDEIPITNAGPDAKINIKRSTRSQSRLVLEIKDNSTPLPDPVADLNPADYTMPEDTSAMDEVVDQMYRDRLENPDLPEPGQPSLGTRMANAFREEFGLEREDELEAHQPPRANPPVEGEAHPDETGDEAPAIVQPAAPPGIFHPLINWFWGDIEPGTGLLENPPAPNEERLNNDRQDPPIRVIDLPPRVPEARRGGERQPEHAEHDPEVVAAAQQAGLDAEAIEDAEDLEGIFELIGFQGPLIGLFQTSCFCSVLVTGTVFAAVGLPYLWGKLVLLFIGNPVSFMLKMPLQFGSMVADIIIDITLLGGSWITIVLTLAMSFLLSAVEAWIPSLAKYDMTEWISDIAEHTAIASETRLQAFFAGAEMGDKVGWNWALLAASAHAHASLKGLEDEVGTVFRYTGGAITSMFETISTGSVLTAGGRLFRILGYVLNVKAGLGVGFAYMEQQMQPLLETLRNLKTGALTFESPRMPIDPSLVFWSSNDRALAVITGYIALAAMAAVYVALDTPISKSQTGRRLEKTVRDTLKQAGGVLKVILIISIEMLVFPLYCGFLLDLAFLPLFGGASVSTRWAFAVSAPYTFGFVHWFVGTCYMFHFALFVGMCRKILRKGVLWFIRDPDDPTFHPVRDVLERNVTTQLRKIAFSALVYGALVILCLGGVIWSIGHIFKGIFPIHWVSTEPILEFPLDLLLYNMITPFVIRLFKPSYAVHAMYSWWLRRCARMLRLSHFLFNEPWRDEEEVHKHNIWKIFLGTQPPILDEDQGSVAHSRPEGRYVLTPCNDQYRPPKPGEAFLHVDEHDMYIADKDGKKNEHFARIYVPTYFGARVTIFMICLWMFSVFAGLCATLVPLVLGRGLLACALPDLSRVNDVYAYSLGAYTLGGASLLFFHGESFTRRVRNRLTAFEARAWIATVLRHTRQVLKCFYVYGFLGLALPVLFALTLQFYLILPLHTHLHSKANLVSTLSSNGTMTSALPSNDTQPSFVQFSEPGHAPIGPSFVHHTVHLLADYALGLLYVRIGIRMMLSDPASRAAEAFRRITARGWFDPDAELTTRFFVLPATLLALVIFFVPLAIARAVIAVLDYSLSSSPLSPLDVTARTIVYRYSYPVVAGWVLLVLGSLEATRATGRWRARIRDEVYLVGERLHNFGERRPPVGSKSVIRKDR